MRRGPLLLGDRVLAGSWLGGAIALEHRRWSCRDEEFSLTGSTHARVTLTEAGGTERTVVRIDGRDTYDGVDRPGALSFVPAQAERQYRYRGAALTYTALWIEARHATAILGNPVTPIINGHDRFVAALLSELRGDLEAGDQPSTLYIEHLAALVLLRLARAKTDDRKARPLDAKRVARVREYVQAHLTEDLSVEELATAVDLPADRFARAFRIATGSAPYAHVLEQRVARAESLLRTSRLTLAEIAHAVGFSSQSHFTTAFRKLTGSTPAAYRRASSPR